VKHSIDRFSIEPDSENGGDLVVGGTLLSVGVGLVAGIPFALALSPWIWLWWTIPAFLMIMGITHDGKAPVGVAVEILRMYNELPGDAQAQIPLTRDWMRNEYPNLDGHGKDAIYAAVQRAHSAWRQREAEEATKLVAYKHIVEAAREVETEQDERANELRKINREMKELL
jgi:hypothetical protein